MRWQCGAAVVSTVTSEQEASMLDCDSRFPAWVFSRYSSIPPQSKNTHIGLIGGLNWSSGMSAVRRPRTANLSGVERAWPQPCLMSKLPFCRIDQMGCGFLRSASAVTSGLNSNRLTSPLLASFVFIQKSPSPSPHLFFNMIYNSKKTNKQTEKKNPNTFIKTLFGRGSPSVLQFVPLSLLTAERETAAGSYCQSQKL